MKYLKIFMMLAVATLFVACSDDDEEWGNPANATVELASAEIRIKENKGIFNIPIQVNGEKHGRIQVTVKVTPAEENGAVADEHYRITSQTIVISSEDNIGNIEVLTVDDDDINNNREFVVTIEDVKGATAVEGTQSVVILRDNDAEFYDKLMGKWTMTVTDPEDPSTPVNWSVDVVGFEEDEEGYNQTLYVVGMMGYAWTAAELAYNFDQENNKVTVSFIFPSLFAEGVNFGLGESNEVHLWGVDSEDNYTIEPLVGEVSEDFKTITFDENGPAVYGRIAHEGGESYTNYIWFGYNVISMTR